NGFERRLRLPRRQGLRGGLNRVLYAQAGAGARQRHRLRGEGNGRRRGTVAFVVNVIARRRHGNSENGQSEPRGSEEPPHRVLLALSAKRPLSRKKPGAWEN